MKIFFSKLFQLPVGNLHLMSTAAVILAYFTRRTIIINTVSSLVTVFSLVSIIAGGLVTGDRGNVWAVSGGGVLVMVASVRMRRRDETMEEVINCLTALANILLMKGMITDEWELPNIKYYFI